MLGFIRHWTRRTNMHLQTHAACWCPLLKVVAALCIPRAGRAEKWWAPSAAPMSPASNSLGITFLLAFTRGSSQHSRDISHVTFLSRYTHAEHSRTPDSHQKWIGNLKGLTSELLMWRHQHSLGKEYGLTSHLSVFNILSCLWRMFFGLVWSAFFSLPEELLCRYEIRDNLLHGTIAAV